MAIDTPITKADVKPSGFQERNRTFGTYEKLDVDISVPRVLHRSTDLATVGATPGASGTLWTYDIPADALASRDGRLVRLRVLLPSFSTFTGDEQLKVKVGGTYLTTIDIDTGIPAEIEVLIGANKQVQIVRYNWSQNLTQAAVVNVTAAVDVTVAPNILITAASNALTTTAPVTLKLDFLGATNEPVNCTAAMVLVELL